MVVVVVVVVLRRVTENLDSHKLTHKTFRVMSGHLLFLPLGRHLWGHGTKFFFNKMQATIFNT